jgi:glycosyltransferase involved in cell wall biosynthesis
MRLLLITNIFPSPVLPMKGPFNLELVRALSRRHQVRVIAPLAWTDELAARRRGIRLPPGRVSAPDGVNGVEVVHPRYYFTPKILREQYGRFMWHSVRRVVLSQLDRFRPDVVLAYWVHPDGEMAVRAARVAGVPSAVMVGGSDVLVLAQSPGRRRPILNVLNAADAVIPVSNDLKARLIAIGVAPDKIHVVPRGVDVGRFAPGSRAESRRKLGIPADARAVLWVGRMVPVKGLDVLLDACGRLRAGSGVLPFRLYLVGDGPLRETLLHRSVKLGVADAVSFVGAVPHSELGDWYRAADLTVLPSRSEGVPNVLRESLACGTPFVASAVGGIPEIADEATCRLVPPEDPTALAAALAGAIERGRGAVDEIGLRQGTWDDSASALERVLERLRSHRSSAADESNRRLFARDGTLDESGRVTDPAGNERRANCTSVPGSRACRADTGLRDAG